jgi:hypothetical protein
MGEDIGRRGKFSSQKKPWISSLKKAQIQGKPIEVSIGGLNMPAFSIVYRTNAEEEQQ